MMKTTLRALGLILGPLVFGTIIIPFAIWAIDGFPDGDSHGLWFPVIFAMYIGLPVGIAIGLASALAYVLRMRHIANRNRVEKDESKLMKPTGTFDKY
jgi:hypothetical protein